MDKVLVAILADFLINLAAGWAGAALIVPLQTARPTMKPRLLTTNLFLATLFLLLAFLLRKGL
jgi:hypothetical protein